MRAKKIALFYGHVASNIGDLAINKGEVELLREAFPDAGIHVVFLDSADSEFLRLARSSFGDDGTVTFSFFSSSYAKTLDFQTQPGLLLAECGAEDADLVVIASGEHFFSYSAQDNVRNLYWRALPALAAHACGKPCVVLPSTFGPFEELSAQRLVRALTSLSVVAAREPASAKVLLHHTELEDVAVHLDPAFFIKKPASVEKAPYPVLGLAMRSESWGIRLSKDERTKLTHEFDSTGYATSKAFQFSTALCRRFLELPDAKVVIFVQTSADEDLGKHVAQTLESEGYSGRVDLQRPLSVDEYLIQLAGVDYVVGSRFHAMILSIVAGTASFGIYFEAHGHKMPGLFRILQREDNCLNLSIMDPKTAAEQVLAAREGIRKDFPALQDLVEKSKKQGVSWLSSVKSPEISAGEIADAFAAFGALSNEMVRRGFANAQKREVEAQTKPLAETIADLERRLVAARRQAKEAATEFEAQGTAQTAELKSSLQRMQQQVARELATKDSLHAEQLQQAAAEISRLKKAHVHDLEELRRNAGDDVAALKKSHSQALIEAHTRLSNEVRKLTELHRQDLEEMRVKTLDAANRQFGAQIVEVKSAHARDLNKQVHAFRQREKEWRLWFGAHNLRRDAALARSEAEAAAHEVKLATLQSSTSFQVGTLLIAAMRNPLKLFLLPWQIVRAELTTRRRKAAARGRGPILSAEQSRKIRESYNFKGYVGFYKLLEHMELTDAQRAAAFVVLERYITHMLPEVEGPMPAPFEPKALEAVLAPKPTKNIPVAGFESKAAKPPKPVMDFSSMTDADAIAQMYEEEGADFLILSVKTRFKNSPRDAARELLRLARALREKEMNQGEYALSVAAGKLDRSESVLRALYWACQRSNEFLHACNIMLELQRIYGPNPTPAQQEFLQKLHKSPAYQLSLLKLIAVQKAPSISLVPRKLCYILHNTLPYSSGGYATRSHGVLTGIREAGWDVVALSRPGFPLDIKHEMTEDQVPLVDVVDGISYMRILSPRRAGMSALDYMSAAAKALEEKLTELRPSLVMAASNHVTGLPALIAASRLGIPFVYEIRGLWEITRVSREPTFEDNASFHVQRVLEAEVTTRASHAFTLTEPMREELISRGADGSKLDLLPNSCDPSRFEAREKDLELAAKLSIPSGVPVIGYVGTFVDYEGLEDLAEACALLKKRGIEFRLLMVGNENASGDTRGPITEWIDQVARDNGFSDWTILTGRVPYEDVDRYYSLIDVCPFPRKPWPVCEMVSPMKPLEALAMEKAVVVSSVRALQEMIKDGETGVVYQKGSIESLADALERLIGDPALRQRLGQTGRKWVETERTWTQVGKRFARIAEPLISRPAEAASAAE